MSEPTALEDQQRSLKTMTPEEWERRNAQRLEIGS